MWKVDVSLASGRTMCLDVEYATTSNLGCFLVTHSVPKDHLEGPGILYNHSQDREAIYSWGRPGAWCAVQRLSPCRL